ncbi:hypothetical protein F4778DRAFT_149060 [Xylariomycetidae sp. FL2044]|nr:hypothetical protein F4778DRAFT_149060 [Xylariomycetidae sp. FL2044]
MKRENFKRALSATSSIPECDSQVPGQGPGRQESRWESPLINSSGLRNKKMETESRVERRLSHQPKMAKAVLGPESLTWLALGPWGSLALGNSHTKKLCAALGTSLAKTLGGELITKARLYWALINRAQERRAQPRPLGRWKSVLNQGTKKKYCVEEFYNFASSGWAWGTHLGVGTICRWPVDEICVQLRGSPASQPASMLILMRTPCWPAP